MQSPGFDSGPPNRGARNAVPFLLLAAVLAAVGALYWSGPPYSPDSWAYYELSQSLASGHYELRQLRTFGELNPALPSTSFPFLWPLTWALASTVTGLGARAGLLMTLLVVFAFVCISELAGRRFTGNRWFGLCAAMLVAGSSGFFDEVVGARAIPLQLLWVAAALLYTLERASQTARLHARDAAVIGAFAGASIMTRFDMLPFGVTLGLAVLVTTRSVAATGAYGLALLLFVSPWAWMSHHYFGTWFASDSSAVAQSVDPASYVRDWFPSGAGPLTVGEDPLAWLHKLLLNSRKVLRGLARSPGVAGIPAVCAALVLIIAGVKRSTDRAREGPIAIRSLAANLFGSPQARIGLMFLVAAVSMLPLYVLPGYADGRYFSLLCWLLYLWLARGLSVAWRSRLGSARLEFFALMLSGVLASVVMIRAVTHRPPRTHTFPVDPAAVQLARCLELEPRPSSARVLIMDGVKAAQWAAVQGFATSFTPSNFERQRPDDERARLFLHTFNIDFVVGTSQEIQAMFNPSLFGAVEASCGLHVVRVLP